MVIKQRGFTLIEMMVAMGIFGVLMVVAANFLLFTMKSNNQVTIQNEVRQEASKVMQDIIREIRQAEYYSILPNKALVVASASGSITYWVDPATSIFYRNGLPVSADKILYCTTCGSTCLLENIGLTFSPAVADRSTQPLTITLTVQEKLGSSCLKTILTDTVSPRIY